MADKLDLAETNRMREALGMPPLPSSNQSLGLQFKKTDSADASDDEEASTLDTRHAAASSNWHKLNSEQLAKKAKEDKRARLKKERDAAQRLAKLEGKGLGEGDDEMDTKAWLLGQKKRQSKIEKARAQQQEEARLEAEREAQQQYTEKDLAGAKVGHEIGAFDEEAGEQILTLKDANVDADSDEGDELENAQLREAEKRKERQELKKRRLDYDPNDESRNGVLSKYDEEIEGKKTNQFRLGADGAPAGKKAVSLADESIPGRTMVSLDFLDELNKPLASDYAEPREVKMKKPKKKKDRTKLRRREADDDLLPAQDDSAPAPDSMDIDEGQTNGSVAPKRKADESFDDEDLQSRLASQRSAALKKRKKTRAEDLARQLREEDQEQSNAMNTEEDGGLVFDETSCFVSALEANDEEDRRPRKRSPSASPDPDGDDTMPDEPALDEDVKREYSPSADPAKPPAESSTGLDEERSLNSMGDVMTMLTSRGILKSGATGDINAQHRERQRFLAEKQKREDASAVAAQLARQRDRDSGRFQKMSAKELQSYQSQQNAVRDQQDSRQAADVFNKEYRPNVELKYTDEYGRGMGQKEAFKHLSHMFHGKGSGKMKTEKKLRKIGEERERESKSLMDAGEEGMGRAQAQQQRKRGSAGVRLQ